MPATELSETPEPKREEDDAEEAAPKRIAQEPPGGLAGYLGALAEGATPPVPSLSATRLGSSFDGAVRAARRPLGNVTPPCGPPSVWSSPWRSTIRGT